MTRSSIRGFTLLRLVMDRLVFDHRHWVHRRLAWKPTPGSDRCPCALTHERRRSVASHHECWILPQLSRRTTGRSQAVDLPRALHDWSGTGTGRRVGNRHGHPSRDLALKLARLFDLPVGGSTSPSTPSCRQVPDWKKWNNRRTDYVGHHELGATNSMGPCV